MKKLKFYICFAAVLFLTTQFAVAQVQDLGDDPISGTARATNGRFDSDVDLFFDVNSWADMGAAKWFSFLQMGNIDINGIAPWKVWEGGLAIQLSKAYIAVYYNGTYNGGYNDQGEEYISLTDGTSHRGHKLSSFAPSSVGDIDHNNYFGILVGLEKNSFKFTLKEESKTIDVPIYNDTLAPYPDPLYPYTDINKAAGSPAAPDAAGKYLFRNGTITPMIQWGASQDMNFGKYPTRPSASVSIAINYKNEEVWDLTDPDGTAHHYAEYGNNTITPIINFDTGGINFFSGEWGAFSFGVGETFGIQFTGEGDQKAVPWVNTLTPYAKFNYSPVNYFRLAAKLNVPVLVGWDKDDAYYFGIGARGNNNPINSDSPGSGYDTYADEFPTLNTGFQLDLSFIDDITGKNTLLKKFRINWGIKVNLPGFTVTGKAEDNTTATTPPTYYQNTSKVRWVRPDGPMDYFQKLNVGITFNITDKVLIDSGVDFKDFSWKFLISVKH